MSVSRRRLLKWVVGGAAGSVALAGAGIGWVVAVEPHWLVVDQVTLALRRLPPAFDGLRVAQLSDLHIGPYIKLPDIQRAVERALALQPDMFVLTGDFVSRWAGYGKELIEPLRRLRAPLGTYAVLGNHDHWANPEEVASYLTQAEIPVLQNASLPVERDGSALWLVGVDDVMVGIGNLGKALADVPENACKIALVHEPDFADWVARYPVDLQLSGHSHGGQVRLPGLGAPILPGWGRKYPIGLQKVGEMWLYTNRGIGMVTPPVRFNCPPEITLFTLRRAEA